MEAQTVLELLERFDGHGRVYDGDEVIAEVGYALKVIEEHPMHMREESGYPRTIETRALCGFVTPAQPESIASYVATPLTFELEDGRRFACVLTRVTPSYCLVKALCAVPGVST